MGRFKRPDICRLCECPVVDTGVLLSPRGLMQLSDWLEHKTGNKLCFSDAFESENSRVCQFCVWDARFENEHSQATEAGTADGFVWWPEEYDLMYEKYYKGDLLKACYVNLERIRPGEAENEEEIGRPLLRKSVCTVTDVQMSSKSVGREADATYQNYSCVYCDLVTEIKDTMRRHVIQIHGKIAIRCPKVNCATYFRTEGDRKVHVTKFHTNLTIF